MQMKVCRAIFLLTAFAAGTAAAMAQYKSLQPPAPEGEMNGMETSQAKPMDMSKCKMDMSKCKCMDHGMESPVPAGTMRITFGNKSAEWTPATLAALPHQSVTVINGHTKQNMTFSGVPLIELLKQLGVPDKSEGESLRLYLVAEGADGYKVAYSLAEVAPAVSHSTVIVADAMDGKPLAGTVPLQLVNTGDKGLSRCVRNLMAIRVLTVE
jgi:hypothetical protein